MRARSSRADGSNPGTGRQNISCAITGCSTLQRVNAAVPARSRAIGSAMPATGVRHERVQLFVAPPEQLVVDGESRREVLVERGGPDPHLPRDRRERQRAHTDVGHLREGESEDLVDRLLPPPLPAVRCRCRSVPAAAVGSGVTPERITYDL